MPPLVLGAIAALSLSLPLLLWSLLARRDPVEQRTIANLQRGLHRGTVASSDEALLGGEPRDGFGVLARRLTPGGAVRRLDELLGRAGRPAAWPLERVLVVKLLLPLLAGAVALLYLSRVSGLLPMLIAVAVTVLAYFLPDLLLHSRGQERSQRIALELADTLDQMTIAVEAGLGFDSAMVRVGKNGKGRLAEELVRTLQDMQMGSSRRIAYEALARRTSAPDLRRFVRAILQADAYGVAVADVLRTQAGEMRLKRRQRAEEKAMQIPVKVIFPLMLCILPVLFIVLLGPAVMDIVKAFS